MRRHSNFLQRWEQSRWERGYYGEVNADGLIFFPVQEPLTNQYTTAQLQVLSSYCDNKGLEPTSLRTYNKMCKEDTDRFEPFGELKFDLKRETFYKFLDTIRVSWKHAWVFIDVKRDELLSSSFAEFRSLGSHDFHKEFKFRFNGEHVQDAGGPTREWFQLIAKEAFNPDLSLFRLCDNDNVTYEINPNSWVNESHLDYFRFIGLTLGKAIFDKQIMNAPLARPLLKMLLKFDTTLDDVAYVDNSLYNSLMWLKKNHVTSEMSLVFSVQEDRFGEKVTVDLIENGSEVSVTNANKDEYINRRTKYALEESISEQIASMQKGLWEVIPLPLLRMLNEEQLELIVNGMPSIDVSDWKLHTIYEGDYSEAHQTIQWFWEVVENDFSDEDRARLLQFSTGTSRVPGGGFSGLESNRGQGSKFTIVPSEMTKVFDMPRANTCFNRLSLPKYETRDDVANNLWNSVNHDLGFGLED